MKIASPSSTQELEEYNHVHIPRWRMSIDWIKAHTAIAKDWIVLEISRPTLFSEYFTKEFGFHAFQTEFDVRDPDEWAMLSDGLYDMVINTEVIEHLADWGEDPELRGEMLKTGMANCLSGCARVLKPGGILFLTTPNASSLMVLNRWVHYEANFNWDLHVRELGFNEAVRLVEAADFEIVKAATEDPYMHVKDDIQRNYYQWIALMLGYIRAPKENRGETTFIVARKKG